MENRHALILITADDCGHCKSLKKEWPSIEPNILSISSIRIIQIPLSSMSSSIDISRYPRGLKKYKRWFPMLLLVPSQNWNAAISHLGDEVELDAEIMNGVFRGGKSEIEGAVAMTSDNIINWIERSLKKEKFKSGASGPKIPFNPSTSSSYVKTVGSSTSSVCNAKIISRRHYP